MKVFVSREQTSAGLQQREAPRASFKQALTGAERLGQCWSGAEWREDAHSAELSRPVLVSKAFDEAV